jgi:hypothetical protein
MDPRSVCSICVTLFILFDNLFLHANIVMPETEFMDGMVIKFRREYLFINVKSKLSGSTVIL